MRQLILELRKITKETPKSLNLSKPKSRRMNCCYVLTHKKKKKLDIAVEYIQKQENQ